MRYMHHWKKCPTNPEESEALFTKSTYFHPSSLTQMLFIWTNFAVPCSFLLELQFSFFATWDVTDTWNTPKQWSLGFCWGLNQYQLFEGLNSSLHQMMNLSPITHHLCWNYLEQLLCPSGAGMSGKNSMGWLKILKVGWRRELLAVQQIQRAIVKTFIFDSKPLKCALWGQISELFMVWGRSPYYDEQMSSNFPLPGAIIWH